jgi:hypothetical protein
MNQEQYRILYYKDTFTAMGEYRVFVIYSTTEPVEPPSEEET